MTDTINDQPAIAKKPSLIAYHVRESKDGSAFWTRIGAAWSHTDGAGFNIQVDFVPLDGRIALRVPSHKPR
jgi:hypothetical protein